MDPIVQYIIVNREILALGPGVLAAQAAHASVAGYLLAADSAEARAWSKGTFTKIILTVADEAALRALGTQFAAVPIAHKLLEESRLQGKATAIGVAPLSKATVAPVVSHLSLLK